MQGNLAGYAAALGSALCMAFYTLAVGRSAASAGTPAAAGGADRLCRHLPLVPSRRRRLDAGSDLLLGLYLGAGPMGLGYYFWSRAMQHDRGGKVALVAYLTPVASTALLGLAGERLTVPAGLGGLLVIASCLALGLERQEADSHV